ncbi:MAG TPA: bifunctional 2-polyprenyl-6-hydroxyphenol methylase/3-demethylubiquinol 3-O-methyltransferase UbiG [Gammaproteobacteria bacterium]|nr:bifunctional 2-polyprenyl-6-hydroxyphenol methylase/3-demethylubiquinol 3-O-methyltransferase UbiG [Gammaproteobacteria bacterium]
MHKNLEATEIDKFDAMAADWWDPKGKCRPLHALNPTRLQFIVDRCPLLKKSVLDIGCGGGILSESMQKRGAYVTGIDATLSVLEVAKLHAIESNLYKTDNNTHTLNYIHTTAEEYAAIHPNSFDVVTCMELLEHVPDPLSLIKAAATLVKPGGYLFFSTLNRTPKSYLFAVLGAEYLLKLLPRGTHQYEKFIRPSELEQWLRQAELHLKELAGLQYNPLTHKTYLNNDVSINYLAHVEKDRMIR